MRPSSVRATLFLAAMFAGAPLLAQTTVNLNVPSTQVTDTTIQGGSYASTNYAGQPLATKAYSDLTWVRRALLKFDTQNTIPAGATVSAAKLTVTVKSAGTDATRTIAAYP